jgi:hypothetical protein
MARRAFLLRAWPELKLGLGFITPTPRLRLVR